MNKIKNLLYLYKMEPGTILIIVGLSSLIVERIFSWATRIKKSSCCGSEIEMHEKN